ncbi:hypothetical protein [Brevundimonas sp.]|uniref:hypothetical protein n=1 Tax=Brevundimonas sp. TaxID=1871086 RepID=UPI002D489CF3|nr:hypothetical protein [Brevundimonas sp.]HYC66647.1 hypothetical protein [Brevundimonas sp.]
MIALVLGGAPTVWKDLERARRLTAGLHTIIVATNFAGRDYEGHIDVWATLHPELFAAWRAERAEKALNTDYRAFVHRKHGGLADIEVHPLGWSGSSGLYAAQVAVQALDASGVILCGVPMEREAGHYVTPGEWSLVERYRPAWLAAKDAGLPIRSMSGWTAEQFGYPDGYTPIEETPTMRVRFTADFDYTPSGERRVTIAYRAGMELTVKREAGEAAVRAGKAEELSDPLDHDGDGKKGGAKKAAKA